VNRRVFAAGFWLLLGFVSATIGSLAFFIDIRILTYAQGLYTVFCGVVACVYYLDPERLHLNRPDEPAPREWVALGKILTVVVVGSALLLLLANN